VATPCGSNGKICTTVPLVNAWMMAPVAASPPEILCLNMATVKGGRLRFYVGTDAQRTADGAWAGGYPK